MIELILDNSATISTVFFFVFFCMVIFLVFRKGSKAKFDQHSQIPFHDSNQDKKSTKND